jgi:hypothetical protein
MSAGATESQRRIESLFLSPGRRLSQRTATQTYVKQSLPCATAPEHGRRVLLDFPSNSPQRSHNLALPGFVMRRLVLAMMLAVTASGSLALAQLTAGTARVRHAPTLNGPVQGSIQQMTAENTTFNGGASVTGSLFVPGVPSVRLNGNPTYGGAMDGAGSATPAGYTITLNGGAALGRLVRRTDAVALGAVAVPPQPAGTRSVSLNNAGQSAGDFTTLKNLTLNSNVGQIVVPPGTYGNFTANSGGGFAIGVAGAVAPAVYNFQNLTLNSNSSLTVIGPVVVTVNGGFSTNGPMGSAAHPEWLALRIAGGGLSLNGSVSVYANLEAPDGTLTLNGNSRFVGSVSTDRLIINGNSLLQLVVPAVANQPPVVAMTAPVSGATYLAPGALTLAATASDSDGSVAKVEFYEGTAKIGEDTGAPYSYSVSGLAAGPHSFKARAIDNLGAATDSAAVAITVTAANQLPTVSLTASSASGTYQSPVAIVLSAAAADSDGSVLRVEFYQDGVKLGEDLTAPYQFTTSGLPAGVYAFTAVAFDNLAASVVSSRVAVAVSAPNQAPTVIFTAPANGAVFTAPGGFLLAASASDPDGSVAKIEFYQDGSKVGEDTAPPYEHAVGGLVAGTYRFGAKATDNAGLTTDSSVVTVTVVKPNDLPVVALTAPMAGTDYTAPASISLAASASDSDGVIAKVEFFNGPAKIGEALGAPYQLIWSPVGAGSYALTAKATDNSGAVATSGVVPVTVTDKGVPFMANFELTEGYQPGPLHGQKGWSVSGDASVVTSSFYSGSQGISVAPATPPAVLARVFRNADPRVTFVDFFVQPAAAATPAAGIFFETDAARVALTGVSPAGILQGFHGDGVGGGTWLSTERGPALDGSGRAVDWLRLTARSDYGSKKWDLYFNGRMIVADLGFLSNEQASFTGLSLSGHSALMTGFDDLLIAFENPLFADADHDGMDDDWESAHGLNPNLNDRDGDLDGDGLSNIQEYVLGTDPGKADTDGDGLTDYQERVFGTDPQKADTDGDGLPDGWEKIHDLDPRSAADAATDTDGDGLTNLQEFQQGSDPSDYFNGALPVVTSLVSEDGALGPDDTLSVMVANSAGQPLSNAPVTFTATVGGHLLAGTADGPASAEITVRSGPDGIARAYVKAAN